MPELEHFVHFIRTTERGIMPGDPELAALGKHHAVPRTNRRTGFEP